MLMIRTTQGHGERFSQSVAHLGVWLVLSAAVVDHRKGRPSIFKIKKKQLIIIWNHFYWRKLLRPPCHVSNIYFVVVVVIVFVI